ncbi:MAG TPA: lipopolysaccharide heptosyltransferase II [Syntrophaceae bacterium]|jgi:heptosyltransferase-2|nr:lipopolysaccharide heptosyltransferase II [Syntrophaceae bacterium]
MKVRISTRRSFTRAKNILIRGTNWIGDAVMTIPAVNAVRNTFPQARISILAKPWLAEVYRLCPSLDEIILFHDPGFHSGIAGKIKLGNELRKLKFDAAILLQNAIEAAIITWWAGIPIRAGYNSDGRGLLLTHSVQRTTAIRKVHQTKYYLEMVKALGCQSAEANVHLKPGKEYETLSETLFDEHGIGRDAFLIGIAPGAAYGPAKRWFPERFAAVADRLMNDFSAQALLFGSSADRKSTDAVQHNATHQLISLAGKTNLKETIALIARCNLFISNDSGLMHVAGALNIPTVAIFGSTNPITTSPAGDKSVVIYKEASCSPCLKETCPTDFRCMEVVTVEEVYETAKSLLKI